MEEGGPRLKGPVPARPKGLARATRGATIHRRVHPALSRDIEELLFRCADILTEGEIRECRGQRSYFGSTMITCDLRAIEREWRGPFDNLAVADLHRAIDGSVRVKLRAMRIAYAEMARRVSDRPLGTPAVETRVYLAEGKLLLDVDLEVPIGVCSPAEAT